MEENQKKHFANRIIAKLILAVIVIAVLCSIIPKPESRTRGITFRNRDDIFDFLDEADDASIDYVVRFFDRDYIFTDIPVSEALGIHMRLYAIKYRTRSLVAKARDLGFIGQNNSSAELDDLIVEYEELHPVKRYRILKSTVRATIEQFGGEKRDRFKRR